MPIVYSIESDIQNCLGTNLKRSCQSVPVVQRLKESSATKLRVLVKPHNPTELAAKDWVLAVDTIGERSISSSARSDKLLPYMHLSRVACDATIRQDVR
jgi:hypothetical protein